MYDNKNKYDVPHCYESNKMEYTTGRFIKMFFILIILVCFLAPFYLAFNFDNLIDEHKTNIDIIDNTNDDGNIIYVNEFINRVGGPNVYSSTDLTKYKAYEKIKTHKIQCQSNGCYMASKKEYEKGPFIFFIDNNRLGFYDVNREAVIDYFDKYSLDKDFYFILEDGININPDFFFIKKNTDEYAIYDVNQKLSYSYSINEIVSNPYEEIILDYNISPLFKDHILIKSGDKYKIFDYTTGKFLSNNGYENTDCNHLYLIESGEEIMYCEFINNDTKLVIDVNPTKTEASILINDIKNDINYNISNYKLINKK